MKYKCPYDKCTKIYKTKSGLTSHMRGHGGCFSPRRMSLRNESFDEPLKFDTTTGNIEILLESEKKIALNFNISTKMPIINAEECYNKKIQIYKSNVNTKDVVHKNIIQQVKNQQNDTLKENNVKIPSFMYTGNIYCEIGETPDRTQNQLLAVKGEPVEYDLDEEDVVWLRIINERRRTRKIYPVSMDMFELLIDRMEKRAQFCEIRKNVKKSITPDTDKNDSESPINLQNENLSNFNNDVCCICLDGTCENHNFILFCDMCNIAVHQECYGVPYIPAGNWWCRRCLLSPSNAVQCQLCPNTGGALKPTMDGRWMHVICVLWIPEFTFGNAVFFEPVVEAKKMSTKFIKQECYICNKKNVGVYIQCDRRKRDRIRRCSNFYHVTCAQLVGLHMRLEPITKLSDKGATVSVKSSSYCHLHAKADYRSLIDATTDKDQDLKCTIGLQDGTDTLNFIHLRMEKARQYLNSQQKNKCSVTQPFIKEEKMKEIEDMVDIPDKEEFMSRIRSYWMLKRRSQNGVPLIKRLQLPGPHLKSTLIEENAKIHKLDTDFNVEKLEPKLKISKKNKPHGNIKDSKKSKLNEEKSISASLNSKEELVNKYFSMITIRSQLEKARLVIEMIRKREIIKLKLAKLKETEINLLMNTKNLIFSDIMQILKYFDSTCAFHDKNFDYIQKFKNMSLDGIHLKIVQSDYKYLNQLFNDFKSIFKNHQSCSNSVNDVSIELFRYKVNYTFFLIKVFFHQYPINIFLNNAKCLNNKLKKHVSTVKFNIKNSTNEEEQLSHLHTILTHVRNIKKGKWAKLELLKMEISDYLNESEFTKLNDKKAVKVMNLIELQDEKTILTNPKLKKNGNYLQKSKPTLKPSEIESNSNLESLENEPKETIYNDKISKPKLNKKTKNQPQKPTKRKNNVSIPRKSKRQKLKYKSDSFVAISPEYKNCLTSSNKYPSRHNYLTNHDEC
ncbi:Bromodomain and PHD finger-containing protein 1 [Intoshia linei]|uniref:Bromodomain and PHD finger-containing protein 1 n=1 Tax=Intoshia linei TaxID=1819745 RepID=A0A177B4V1_9BILA|nr:Bromodomain and PHD finger-containing protein 1 [Intoshia linei]